MRPSLASILTFAALACSMPDAGLSQPGNKGEKGTIIWEYTTRRSPAWRPAVIAQMFEWTWDSVAAECVDFLGPAGYGYVQGRPNVPPASIASLLTLPSEPPAGTRPGP